MTYRGDGATTDGDTDEEETEQPNPRVEQCLSKLIPLEGVVLDHHLIAAQTFDRVDLLVLGQEFRVSRRVGEDPEHHNRPHEGDDGQSDEQPLSDQNVRIRKTLDQANVRKWRGNVTFHAPIPDLI